jgi:gluconate 5-dehydrogenase
MTGAKDFPPAYQATKAAVVNLTRNLACSWADRGIRINSIAPGTFLTEMNAPFLATGTLKQWAADQAPMGRIGDPDELAGPLLFLASGAAGFVTGQTLSVDGGNSATCGQRQMPEELYRELAEKMPDGRGTRIVPK